MICRSNFLVHILSRFFVIFKKDWHLSPHSNQTFDIFIMSKNIAKISIKQNGISKTNSYNFFFQKFKFLLHLVCCGFTAEHDVFESEITLKFDRNKTLKIIMDVCVSVCIYVQFSMHVYFKSKALKAFESTYFRIHFIWIHKE